MNVDFGYNGNFDEGTDFEFCLFSFGAIGNHFYVIFCNFRLCITIN